MRKFAAVGLAAASLALAFQALTVHYNYGGNWTGLFCIGDRWPQPVELATPYQFHESWGYDGQAYRLIAHDPFLTRGFDRYLDDPRYRYSRGLVSVTAWVLALGDDRWIDTAYLVVILISVFGGAYWLAMVAARFGYPAWFGILFLFAPATVVGIDRLTIDVVLAALCVAFVALQPGSGGWLVTLTLAAMCRETGFLLIGAGFMVLLKSTGKVRPAVLATAVPALMWLGWVAMRLPPSPTTRAGFIPLSGYLARLAHPLHYTFPPVIRVITQTLDYTALAAVPVALWCLWRIRPARPELFACVLPVLFASLLDIWSEVYAFGRTMTPFWLLLAIRGVEGGLWLALVPIALMDVRIGWQLGGEVLGILRGLVT